VVQEIPAPHAFQNRPLRQLAIAHRHGVQVVFMRTRRTNDSAARLVVPRADDLIREGDTLIVAGPKDSVDRIALL